MNKGKIILLAFLFIILLVATHRIVINIISIFNSELSNGVVYKTDVFTGTDGYNTRKVFFLKDSLGVKFDGIYQEKDDFNIIEGDTISFRKLYFKSIRPIKKNNKIIQSYYNLWDFLSVALVLGVVVLFFYGSNWYLKFKKA